MACLCYLPTPHHLPAASGSMDGAFETNSWPYHGTHRSMGRQPLAGSLGYRVDISSQQSTIDWQTFDLGELDTLRASDRLIFVDVTADWCITCKANKTLTLKTGEAISLFTSQNVTMIQADWTLPDDDIARFLASHQRFGIPFNIVYGPSARQGIILPEILTLADIEKELAQANNHNNKTYQNR